MHIFKAFMIALSIYSKIPMPQFPWKEEDMKYMICFFPIVGAVIGGMLYFWAWISRTLGIGTLAYVGISMAIPILITGGFHLDGYMDTMDAFRSYQPRERKLEILKDPHIGAFSVIMLVLYGLIYMAGISEIHDMRLIIVLGAGFFLSRALSGIGIVCFKTAKKDGSLFYFANNAHKRIVRIVLIMEAVLCVSFMMWISFWDGFIVAVMAIFLFGYYYERTKKELGGITGDTAGYFVTICELGTVLALAILQLCR